jgi:hypothetical protein
MVKFLSDNQEEVYYLEVDYSSKTVLYQHKLNPIMIIGQSTENHF